MKKYSIPLLTFLFLRASLFAQVTVTGGTNTTPNLAATYTSLANAITALNTITVISGPVSITLNASNPQTAPAGGYVIQFSATTTATNSIFISGSGNTITAFTPQTAGQTNDAIFKLIGVDYVYLYNFVMREHPSNTTMTVGTNNMTEWGVALLRASQTNGAKNNYISYNDIALNRLYANTFGIYSNVMHAAATPTVTQDITSTGGSNSNDTIINNTISNVANGIVFTGSSTAAFMDQGNSIGGTYSGTGNTLTNWGNDLGGFTAIFANALSRVGVGMRHQNNENVSYNNITSASVGGGSGFFGIFKNYLVNPTGTISSVISNNTISVSITSGTILGIQSDGINSQLSTSTISITNNTISNCIISGASAGSSMTGIVNSSDCGRLHITDNIIKANSSTATSGGFNGITNSGDVVDTININSNILGDNTAGPISFSNASTGSFQGIYNNSAGLTVSVNINYNRIDNISAVSLNSVNMITAFTWATGSLNILNNNLGTLSPALISFSGVQTGDIIGITSWAFTGSTVNIQSNWIRGIVHSVQGSANHTYFSIGGDQSTLNLNDNLFDNLNVNTTGNVYFIYRPSSNFSGTSVCNNNQIVSAFNKAGAGGTVRFYYALNQYTNGSSMTETGNNFSNVTVTGSTQVVGWSNLAGFDLTSGPTKTITNNTFSNITGGSGAITIMETGKGNSTNCSSNTITGISSTGAITGISILSNNGSGTHDYASNTISSLVSSGTGGDVKGITGGSVTITTLNINNNNMVTFSSTGASSTISGIEATGGVTININNNSMSGFTGTGTASPLANGIVVSGGTNVNVFRNYLYTISEMGLIGTTSPAVNGMLFSGGTNVTLHTNFVSNMRAPSANLTDAVRTVSITSTTPSSTYNLYYNSINTAATSSGANFGTTSLYHAASATGTTAALNLKDNLICNTSTPNGTGLTVAFRRSGTALNNYASTSDYNDFYGGVPAANRLIYYDGTNSDQTFANFQTRVATRETNSLGIQPIFTAVTELHLRSDLNCALDGRGTPIAGITTDIDNATRDATTPDMGADEINPFYFLNTLAGVNGAAVCENKTVSASGTTFANSSACNLIATIQPSGGDPVSGKVNACVTLDATQQYFNAEPYVQRHYDIEPLVSNTTTTSATITLYFTDAEFSTFNTNNPVWPKLPTVAGGGNADPNIANLKVTQYHGTATTTPSTPGNYTANFGSGTYINPVDANIVWNNWYWAVTFNVTGFSGFYVHTNISFPLPVTINYFRGIKQGNDHLLSWKINCNTTPGITMTLERSDKANTGFIPIAAIATDAIRCAQPFDHRDVAPLKGMNYYRLKITDNNGKITYSSTIALLNAVSGSELVSIAPNPVSSNGSFRLNVASAKATKMELIIVDMQGRKVQQQNISLIAGHNSIDMNVGKLSPGTYYIRSLDIDAEQKTLRFVKQ